MSLMISGTFYRWHLFAKGAYLADDYHGTKNQDSVRDWRDPREIVFATLNTPLETCLAAIRERNGGREVNDHQIKNHRTAVLRAAQKFAEAGDQSVWIDRERSYQQVEGLLRQGGWNPEADQDPPTGEILIG